MRWFNYFIMFIMMSVFVQSTQYTNYEFTNGLNAENISFNILDSPWNITINKSRNIQTIRYNNNTNFTFTIADNNSLSFGYKWYKDVSCNWGSACTNAFDNNTLTVGTYDSCSSGNKYSYVNYTVPYASHNSSTNVYEIKLSGNNVLQKNIPLGCVNETETLQVRIYMWCNGGIFRVSIGECLYGSNWLTIYNENDPTPSPTSVFGMYYDRVAWRYSGMYDLNIYIGDDQTNGYTFNGLYNSSQLLDMSTNIESVSQSCDCSNCTVSGTYNEYCDIPITFKTNSSGILEYTNVNYTTDYNFTLTNCSYGTPSINFTVYDEETENLALVDVIGTFYYNLYGEEKTLDIDFSNTNNFSVCVSPSMAKFTGNYTLSYSEKDYPQKNYVDLSAFYLNTTQVINLYVLNTTEGGYIYFNTLNSIQSTLSGVTGTIKKNIGGTWTTIQQVTSDDSGLMEFFVNFDTLYQVTFSKAGYVSQTFTIQPITTDIRTVIMQPITATTQPAYDEGISIKHYPVDTSLNNDTMYNFTYTLNSSIWELTDCNMDIYNGSSILQSIAATRTSTYCNATIEIDVLKYSNLYTRLRYEINGSIDQVVNTYYKVNIFYVGQFSLWNFIEDINDFAEDGFNNFTRLMIGFVIVLVLTAYVSSIDKDLSDSNSIIFILILSIGLVSYFGWFYLDYEPISNLGITGFNKYFIFYFTLLIGGSYLLKEHLVK